MNHTDPAFPGKIRGGTYQDDHGLLQPLLVDTPGITSRAYAAIHLRVPDSGEGWLDKMILESLGKNKTMTLADVALYMETLEQRGKK